MKKIFIMLLVAALFSCNNEESTETGRTDSTTIIEQDNTVNRDTGMNLNDTIKRRDSLPNQ